MNKIFGMPIALFVVGLLVIGTGTALVVNYLSNTATADVKIESPMVMAFEGETYGETATKDLGIVYGGDNIYYKVHSKNQASVDIDSYPITTIISYDSEWTGQEFTSVNFKDVNYPTNGIEILSYLYVVQDGGTLKLFTDGNWNVVNKKSLKLVFNNGNLPYTHIPGETWNEMTITTKQGIAPGNYAMKLCHLDDLLGNCQ